MIIQGLHQLKNKMKNNEQPKRVIAGCNEDSSNPKAETDNSVIILKVLECD